ncbi:MAG: glycogen synthase GlgA [Planctomycetota bacterium]|nr:glycogen synthase GlgA [Planctomycetota bacterium]
MHICFATSEAVPFAKTGGLADVCGALPCELAKLGHTVTLVMPAYRGITHRGQAVQSTDIEMQIPVGGKLVAAKILVSQLPDSDVTVYFVQQDDYFDRDGVYGAQGVDYEDNCERFVFFCRAVIQLIQQACLDVDLIHAHDWTTGLIPALLKIESGDSERLSRVASLMTIHNLAYQGTFWHWDMLLTGIDWKYFNWQQMEFHGDLNLLKTGLVFADALNTVSPTYAEEIQSAPLGCGLEDVLRDRRAVLSGIINGVDSRTWDPADDRYLATTYSIDSYGEGKRVCKRALQREFGLQLAPDRPLIGFVGRLAGQKGFDLALPVMQAWAEREDVQWAVLGTGDRALEKELQQMSRENAGRIGVVIDFSEPLAHRIEAGADIFLMPSAYEPCGLNQLYSLKYGTLPVVHQTGGLADTVVGADVESLAARAATGFSFDTYDRVALAKALEQAITLYNDRPDLWKQMIETAMQQDWSWRASAARYSVLYTQTIARHHTTVLTT